MSNLCIEMCTDYTIAIKKEDTKQGYTSKTDESQWSKNQRQSYNTAVNIIQYTVYKYSLKYNLH